MCPLCGFDNLLAAAPATLAATRRRRDRMGSSLFTRLFYVDSSVAAAERRAGAVRSESRRRIVSDRLEGKGGGQSPKKEGGDGAVAGTGGARHFELPVCALCGWEGDIWALRKAEQAEQAAAAALAAEAEEKTMAGKGDSKARTTGSTPKATFDLEAPLLE